MLGCSSLQCKLKISMGHILLCCVTHCVLSSEPKEVCAPVSHISHRFLLPLICMTLFILNKYIVNYINIVSSNLLLPLLMLKMCI